MKRLLAIVTTVCIAMSMFAFNGNFCVFADGDTLTYEQITEKNYPIPKDYELSKVYTFDEIGVSDEGCFYDKASRKIETSTNDGEKNITVDPIGLDGIGFMFWYKSENGGRLRIRNQSNSIVLEASLSACSEGKWVTYYYYGKYENISPKSDAPKDITASISEDDTYKFMFHGYSGSSSDPEVSYFDEFYTFKPVTTPADTYNSDSEAFKFSIARLKDSTKTVAEYFDDGSVKLTSDYGETASNSPINITYNADFDQFEKAVEKACLSSGYLQMKVDNISCLNSSGADSTAKITITFNGIEKTIIKSSYGSGTSDIYLLKVDDIDNAGDLTSINIKITGSSVKNVAFKLSPITVFSFAENELILQAEDLNPQISRNSVVSATTITDDSDKNRTYVSVNNVSHNWVTFDLPELAIGEYELYASIYSVVTTVQYNICVNNRIQIYDALISDSVYTTAKHNSVISLGKITISKNYSDGKSVLKFKSVPGCKNFNFDIDYFSLIKTDTAVTAEPSSNFEVKAYPEMQDYEVKTVLDTFDDYICGADSRYYKENLIAGYVGDGNAYNLNSRGTNKKANFDNNTIWSGEASSLDGVGIRFWYKTNGPATFQFCTKSSTVYTKKITSTDEIKNGAWVTIYYKDLTEDGDLSEITKINMKNEWASEYYIDELHTIRQKAGEVIYSLNGDGTASVTGYSLRLEDVVIASEYKGCPVTSIKEGALSGSLTMTKVTLPDSIVSIEKDAFKGNLNMTEVNLGKGVKTIGENAFYGCKKLGETELSSSITAIDSTAFGGCENVILGVSDNSYQKQFAIENSLNYHCSNSDYDYFKIGEQIKINSYIGNRENVVLPSEIDNTAVKSISEKAFSGTGIKSFSSSSVENIEKEAFENCSSLESVTLSSVLTVGENAFYNCISLKNAELGEKVTGLSAKAFGNCTAIEKITLPASLETIADDAFLNCYDSIIADVVKGSAAYTYVNSEKTAMRQIPNTSSEYKYSLYKYEATVISYIGNDTVLNIPAYIDEYPVVAVGDKAFYENDKITFVKFPEKCKKIGVEAFYECTALEDFDINNIRSIASKGFAYCTSLGTVTLTNIVSYETDSFLGCTNIKIQYRQTQFARSALELTNSWHVGINLGNRFEFAFEKVNGTPAYTGNISKAPTVTKERIDFYAESGFDVLRLPVTWLGFTDDSNNYTIDEAYLEKVKQVVDWAIDDNMYVILNVHHDTVYWLNLKNYGDEAIEKYERIWEQIADYFKDYDEHLIFESINEERYNEDWDGNTSGLDLHTKFNDLQKRFYNIVRNSGSYNDTRYLMLETYAAQAKEAHFQKVWCPTTDEDDHIIMSVHHYDGRIGESYYDLQFGYAKKYFIDKGIPCVLGETGKQRVNMYDVSNPISDETYEAENTALGQWTDAMMTSADNYGVKVILWEDNGSFGMVNHSTLKWDFPKEIEAAMAHAYPENYTVTIDGVDSTTTNGVLVMPTSSDGKTVAYTDGENYYTVGEKVRFTGNISLSAVKLNLTMLEGASFRINNSTGIRFYTSVEKNVISALRDKGYSVSLGTLITPADILNEADLTPDFEGQKVDVKYSSNGYYTEPDFEGIVGSIVDIKTTNTYNSESGNITRAFVGRGYAVVSKGDLSVCVCADYALGNSANNTRSICYLAYRFKQSSGYADLSEENKKTVDFYEKFYN